MCPSVCLRVPIQTRQPQLIATTGLAPTFNLNHSTSRLIELGTDHGFALGHGTRAKDTPMHTALESCTLDTLDRQTDSHFRARTSYIGITKEKLLNKRLGTKTGRYSYRYRRYRYSPCIVYRLGQLNIVSCIGKRHHLTFADLNQNKTKIWKEVGKLGLLW